ncbi:hypothetical protein IC620_14845 [Hazenella sp. IB182357]|uniref:Uncharacterized protein n=1 Tax=Polycladospora coralii TaxID=2771432 RepID=A0A926RVB4_9BACL|nr:hypothetical protein [Polycladospora coralii]MBD1373622.1 hypothetical protein [Polycladospora coralii]MBS7529664.1 hypothetical protein [Polycladospora coralii]
MVELPLESHDQTVEMRERLCIFTPIIEWERLTKERERDTHSNLLSHIDL